MLIYAFPEKALKELDANVQLLPDEIIKQTNLDHSQISQIHDMNYISSNFHYLFNNEQSNEFFKNIYEYIKHTLPI